MKSEIEAWIKQISDRPEVKAINIGLFQAGSVYQAYLIGSFEYDPEDDDWACNEDYVPEYRYLELPGTSELGWETLLDLVSKSISEIIADNADNILNHVPVVTVGFDDGNLIRIK